MKEDNAASMGCTNSGAYLRKKNGLTKWWPFSSTVPVLRGKEYVGGRIAKIISRTHILRGAEGLWQVLTGNLKLRIRLRNLYDDVSNATTRVDEGSVDGE